MLKLKVINCWGGPGSGKSTLAAGLFNLMKAKGHSVELVTEFAKDLTYAKDFTGLSNQLLILGEQDMRLRRLEGQVEWAITDSPLPTGLAYMSDEYAAFMPDVTLGAYDRYRNYDIWVNRGGFEYRTEGRNQTHSEALAIDGLLSEIFITATGEDEDFTFATLADSKAPYAVLEWLMAEGDE